MEMGILIVSILLSLTIISVLIINIKRAEMGLKKYEINIEVYKSITLTQVDEILDKIINDTFNEYMFNNILYNDNLKFISDDKQKEIIYTVSSSIIEKISKDLIDLIKLYYNEDSIYDIIGSKVYFLVNNYCTTHNLPK